LSFCPDWQVLSFCPDSQVRPHRTLNFGSRSRLRDFSVKALGMRVSSRSFVQVTSRSLKVFRMSMEFEANA
jgi:hypothetical protein